MGKAEYARIPSSTDDEEKSLGYTTQTSPAHFYVRFSRSPFLYLLDFALALVVIFLLIWRNVDAKVQRLELQDDITGYAPKFSHRLVTFKSEPQFISNHSSLESLAEAREYWKTLVPRKCDAEWGLKAHRLMLSIAGQGFIELNDERATNFDIPKKINFMVNGVERHFLGTSIVHSVHCLYSIMAEYDAVVLGIRKQPIDTWHMV